MKIFKIVFIIAVAFILGFSAYKFFIKKSPLTDKSKAKQPSEEGKIHHEGQEVHINKNYQQLLGVETVNVKKEPLLLKIAVTGQIAQDVENVNNITPSQSGVMTDCRTQVGSIVQKDEVLCLIKNENSGALSEIKSPRAGVVIADFHKVGDKVDTVSAIHAIADLSKLWANFDIYEKDVSQIKLGQKILIHSIAYPDETFDGEIVFISPRVDDVSRTIKIRAVVQNSKNLLKLGMFVNGEIVSKSEESYLTVPPGAIQTLGDKKIVFKEIANGKFLPQEVHIKTETADQAALLNGINEADVIAAKGAFLLKSALLADQLEGE